VGEEKYIRRLTTFFLIFSFRKTAGVRTMALVAMGASAFTVVSAYGFVGFDKYDASRMAASVASGVGFVGAGVITTTASDKSQNVVHGLTTAATIW
jgi:putative Mg2+ transporter-C (MgtC) family protein